MDRSGDQSVAPSAEEDGATVKLRQGSILPRTVRDWIGMLDLDSNPDPVVVVISHDCDLVKPHKDEPQVELIEGRTTDKMKGGLSHAQSPRTLQLEFEQNGATKILELCALNKISVDKKILIDVDPDPHSFIVPNGVQILREWLAARYNRAALPDELVRRMKPLKGKLGALDPEAVLGIWFQYEPEDDYLPAEVPYELKIKIVYSTTVYDARAKAEQEAGKLRLSFEKNFFQEGLWRSIDLRICEAVADTVFSVRDLLDYKRWRLDYLSLRQDPPGEHI